MQSGRTKDKRKHQQSIVLRPFAFQPASILRGTSRVRKLGSGWPRKQGRRFKKQQKKQRTKLVSFETGRCPAAPSAQSLARSGLHAKGCSQKATPPTWKQGQATQPCTKTLEPGCRQIAAGQNLKYLAAIMTEARFRPCKLGAAFLHMMEHHTSRVPSKTGWSHATFNWIQIPLLLHVGAWWNQHIYIYI